LPTRTTISSASSLTGAVPGRGGDDLVVGRGREAGDPHGRADVVDLLDQRAVGLFPRAGVEIPHRRDRTIVELVVEDVGSQRRILVRGVDAA
jgi:hypothetical protein